MLRYNKSKFVGRKHEQSIFSQYIEVIHSPVPILDVYGPGGIGKTSLLECFNNIASENKSLVLKVDLEGSKTILDILFTLTSSVKTQKFKNFKAAKKRWNKIWEKVADVSHPKFQRISSLSKDLTSAGIGGVVGAVIGGPLGLLLGTAAGTFGGFTAEEITEKGLSVFSDAGLSIEDAVFAMDPSRTLTLSFLQDVKEIAKKNRILLMFDSYEQVKRLDEWFRFELLGKEKELVESIHIVIAGRDPLPYDWKKLNRQIISLSLKPFSVTESANYIKQIGISSKKQITQIVEVSKGIPFLLKHLSESLLPSTKLYKQEKIDILTSNLNFVERILNHLSLEQRSIIEAASILREFDQDVLSTILDKEVSREDFNSIVNVSFINIRAERKWALREEIRLQIENELKKRSPETYNKYHNLALKWFLKQSGYPKGKLDLSSALEAFYHSQQENTERGLQLYQNLFNWVCWPPNLMACEALIAELDIAVYKKVYHSGWVEFYKARLYILKNQWDDAKELFRKVGNNHENEALLQALALEQLGQIEFHQGYLDIAFSVFRRAHKIFQERNYVTGINTILNNLGRISRRTGRRDLAMAYHQIVIESISQNELQSPLQLISAYRCISRLFRDQGKWSNAIESCNKSLELARQHGYRYDEAIALIRIAELYCYQGRWDEAYIACETTLPILSSYENSLSIAAAYDIFGRVATWTHQFDQALSHYVNSLWFYNQVSANIGIVLLYLDIARLNQFCGAKDRALDYTKNAIDIAKTINDESLRASCDIVKAGILRSFGNWESAKELYERSLEILSSNGNRYREADASIGLAICNWNLFKNKKEVLFDRIFELLKEEEYPDLSALMSILVGTIEYKQQKKKGLNKLRTGFEIAAKFAKPLAEIFAQEILTTWNIKGNERITNILSSFLRLKEPVTDNKWINSIYHVNYDSGEIHLMVKKPLINLSPNQYVFLFHHGQTTARVKGLIQGRNDFPISPETEANLPIISEKFITKLESLSIDLATIIIYCSPARRAYKTALDICSELYKRTKKKPEIRILQSLENISLGSWEGQPKFNVYKDPKGQRLSNGRDFLAKASGYSSDGSPPENLLQVLDRVQKIFIKLVKRSQNTIFVGHKMSLIIPGVLALAPNLLKDPDGAINWRRLEFPSGGYMIFHENGYEICLNKI